MGFQVGDKISRLSEKMDGVILSLTAYKAIVKDEFGFEINVLLSDIVKCSNFEDYKETLNQIPIGKIVKEEKIISKKNILKKVKEIDLHMHNLSGYSNNMSNHEIVLYQLNAVETAIRKTDKRYFSKIVFIHGVGSGKLKKELQVLLSHKSIKYQDANYQKYGQGALEVIL